MNIQSLTYSAGCLNSHSGRSKLLKTECLFKRNLGHYLLFGILRPFDNTQFLTLSSACEYRMRLNFRGTKLPRFSRFRRPSTNRVICKYFQQVLQNHKNGHQTMPFALLLPLYWPGSTNTDDSLLDISHLWRFPGTLWSTMVICSQHLQK